MSLIREANVRKNMNMIHFIYTVLILNASVFGYCLGDGYFNDFNFKGIVIYSVFLSIFGGLAVLLVGLYRLVEWLFKKVNEYFQLQFLWKYHFTDEFNSLTDNQLSKMNRITINHHSSNSIKDKIWRYTMKLANERNGYTYNP